MNDENSKLKEIHTKMAGLCSRSEQCSSDIRKKIIAAGFDNDATDSVIEKLKHENFIDDRRFVRSYISEKFRINKWGKIKIRYYLRIKGLDDDLIQNGLDEMDEEVYCDVLVNTLKEKARSVKKKNKYEKMGQIIRFAQNRGFEPELIHRYLNEAIE